MTSSKTPSSSSAASSGSSPNSARKCSREGCAEPATASCLYDPRAARAWLSSLESDQEIHPQAFLLCVAHADKLVVPTGWTLTDLRVVGDPQLATYLASKADHEPASDEASGTAGQPALEATEPEPAAEAVPEPVAEAAPEAADETDNDPASDSTADSDPDQHSNVIPIESAPKAEDDMPLLRRAFRSVT